LRPDSPVELDKGEGSEVRTRAEVVLVQQLAQQGRSNSEIARVSLSVARRGSVALLDQFVGPKR
jgi:hypothetical protein